jgi:hypothetical protein
MSDRSHQVDEKAIDLALRGLAVDIRYPPTPDLADAVRRRLDAGDLPAPMPWRSGWRLLRRSSLAALAALLLLVGAVLAIGIGLRGLSIVFVESSPPAVADRLELGTAVTPAEAQARAPFGVLVPTDEIGEPDEVYVDEADGVFQVSLVYRSDTESGGVEMLITEFHARTEQDVVVKELGPRSTVEPVPVRGEPGFWISGEPHVLVYLDPSGRPFEDRVRLVGDVLVWQRGEVTLRLEGASSREAALRIADSMD